MSNINIYANLLTQFDKIFKHNRQGSYKTRQRYKEAFIRFLHFLAAEFRVERIANIAPKHVAAYVAKLDGEFKMPSYIKTELSAIRFFHDQIPNARHKLPDNASLNLQKRQYGQVDRTCSIREFNGFVAKAIELGREDYVTILYLARYAALRLHECFRIDTQIAAIAVKTGEITVKGKGGLVRTVPINSIIEIELKKMLAVTPRGHKLFVQPGDKTHLAMQRFEEFIRRHKPTIQDFGSMRPLHFHGLRHPYVKHRQTIFSNLLRPPSRPNIKCKITNLPHNFNAVAGINENSINQLVGQLPGQTTFSGSFPRDVM